MEQEKKKCTACEQEKPLCEFNWRNKAKGIRHSRCNICRRLNSKTYYHKRGGKELKRIRHVEHRNEHIEGMRKYGKGKKRKIPYNPTTAPAKIALSRAVKKGIIQRPDACSQCGATGKIEAHHHNGYDKIHYLDVVWLCRSCHDLIEHPEFAKLLLKGTINYV